MGVVTGVRRRGSWCSGLVGRGGRGGAKRPASTGSGASYCIKILSLLYASPHLQVRQRCVPEYGAREEPLQAKGNASKSWKTAKKPKAAVQTARKTARR